MNKCREAFEKLEDIKDILNDHDIFFNEKIGVYTATKVLGLDSVSYPHWEVTYVNGAFYSYLEQQKRIDELQAMVNGYKKLTISIRNEFDLWSDDSEFADVIEAQIENLEALKGGEK